MAWMVALQAGRDGEETEEGDWSGWVVDDALFGSAF